MPRTTPERVGGIIRVRSGDDLDPFIEYANALVTQYCVKDPVQSDEELERVERMLSAHFYQVMKPPRIQEWAGSVGQQNAIKVDKGLEATVYGQQAMIVDSSGGLAAWNKKVQAGATSVPAFRWMGCATRRYS
jgi:hypothetical protein